MELWSLMHFLMPHELARWVGGLGGVAVGGGRGGKEAFGIGEERGVERGAERTDTAGGMGGKRHMLQVTARMPPQPPVQHLTPQHPPQPPPTHPPNPQQTIPTNQPTNEPPTHPNQPTQPRSVQGLVLQPPDGRGGER